MKAGKAILIVILGIIGIYFSLKLIGAIVFGVLGLIFKLAIPAVIVLAVLYGIYRLSDGGKSLPGSGRSLP